MKAIGSWMFFIKQVISNELHHAMVRALQAETKMHRSEVQPVYSHKKWEVGRVSYQLLLDMLNELWPHN